jgi:hypothetical protein
MRALIRSLARITLGLITALSIVLLLCWIGFPRLAGPITDRFLAGTGWELAELEARRPGLDGIRIDRLELTGPGVRIRAESLRATWTPAARSGPGLPGMANGRLDALDVAHLQVDYRVPPSASGPAEGSGPVPGAWLPSAVLEALPLARMRVPDLQIRMAAPDDPATPQLAISGSLDLDPAGAQLLGRTRGSLLRTPVDLELELDADDRIRLQLGTVEGTGLAAADVRLRAHGNGLGIEGRLRIERGAAALLPSGSLPEVSGRIEGSLVLERDSVRLELLPGTRIETRLPTGPDQQALLTTTPDAVFGIGLEGDRIRSTGTLPLQLHADGPVRARAGLRVSDLGGTLTAPRVSLEAEGRIEDDAAGYFAEGSVELGLARDDAGLLRIEPDGRIRVSRLGQTLEGGWQLARLRLVNRTPILFDPARRALQPMRLELSAAALHRGERHATLPDAPLQLHAAPDETGGRLDLQWDHPDAALTATLRYRSPEATTAILLERLRLPLGSSSLAARLGTLFADLLPAEGWPLRRGRLSLDGEIDWPLDPESGAALNLRLEDAALGSGPLDLDGLTLSARWRGGRAAGRLEDIDLTLATAEYRPGPTTEPWRAAGIEIGAALQARAEGAALGGNLPELELEQLELDLRRAVIAGVGIDRVRLDGTASRSAGETRADLRLAAGALDPGVPMKDLACGLLLDADGIHLDDCSVALLGGEFRAPHGHYDPETGTGAIPIALIGLDLGAVLALMQDSSLGGTGTLDGAVPLRIDGTPPAPTITDGFGRRRAAGRRPPLCRRSGPARSSEPARAGAGHQRARRLRLRDPAHRRGLLAGRHPRPGHHPHRGQSPGGIGPAHPLQPGRQPEPPAPVAKPAPLAEHR